MPGPVHDIEFDVIEEGNESPYDGAPNTVQEDGSDVDA